MKIPKRYRTSLTLKRQIAANSSRQTSLDTWLVRLSHLSQFGLFALTIGTLYFTVIPLYKTAALEEAIARREAELRDAENRLIKAEKALQDVTENIYIRDRGELLRKFIMQAGAECSGLLREPEKLIKLGEHRPERPLLDIDVAKCLTERLNALKPAEKIRQIDYQQLVINVDVLGKLLEQRRADALKQIAAVPEKAAQDRTSWAPKGAYEQALEEIFARSGHVIPRPRNRDQIELDSAIRRTQRAIAAKFEQNVRDEVDKLRTAISWSQNSVDSK